MCSYLGVFIADCAPSSYLNESARKASKSKNTKGNPFKLPSKILAVASDPEDPGQIYIAEAAGTVKRIKLEVGQTFAPPSSLSGQAFIRVVVKHGVADSSSRYRLVP